jgi:hypothetical protein
MNPEKLQPEVTHVAGNAVPKDEEHPFHILDNQVDPEVRKSTQKPLRTYEGDIAEALANRKTSVVTMAIAESQSKNHGNTISNKPPSQTGRKIFIALLSIVFIASGLAGGYYLYLQSPISKKIVQVNQVQIPKVIPVDSQRVVGVPSLKKSVLIEILNSSLGSTEVNPNTITEFVLAQTIASSTQKIKVADFINTLDLGMLDSLKRSLTESWMVGVSSDTTSNHPFIIFKTDFFQNAYSGMLKWESTMPEELADIFKYRQKAYPTDPTASTTSTYNLFNIQGKFTDKVIANRDVREFTALNGELLLLYTFIDKNTILISTSESVIYSVISSIEKQTYVR